ncbi:MAG TPA: hypothetical protein VLW48_03000 [Candidatus Bathyarchaeia archaeon]|nr:hypothetical protein [Candidatus Bathyarchaeia archaeon]
MKPSRLWKFVLLTLTAWLAFAVASPAQGIGCTVADTWANDCGSGSNPINRCTLNADGVCPLQVGESNNMATSLPSGNSNTGIVCLVSTSSTPAHVQWETPAANAGFVIQFGGSSPLQYNGNQIGVAVGTSNAPTLVYTVPTTNNCFEYAVAYCPPGQACVSADPKILVGIGPGIGAGKK